MFQKPKTAKRLHWDVIPRTVDEYSQHLRAYPDQELKAQLMNPAWHIHGGTPPGDEMVVPFAMLLNLASVTGAEDRATLWGFLARYAPGVSAQTNPGFDAAVGRAVAYYQDKVKPTRVFREADAQERAALADLAARLRAWEGEANPEALQDEVYAVGKDHAFENLRDWFKALYEVLLGASQGPRFGGFVALYGIDETAALIERALAGELVEAA